MDMTRRAVIGYLAGILALSMATAGRADEQRERDQLRADIEADRLDAVAATLKAHPGYAHNEGKYDGTVFRARTAEMMKLLIGCGADVDEPGPAGVTPLHFYASYGKNDRVNLLLRFGAKVSAPANDGSTALHAAAYSKRTETIVLLVAKGAKVNARDRKGRTPVYYAIMGGSKAVVKLLIDKGARLDVEDKDGITPRECAVLERNPVLADYVRSRGGK